MANITFTIPDAKLQRVMDAMKGLYPIPQVNNGTEANPDWQNEFSDNAWAKESVRRFIRGTVARYEQKVAKDAIAYDPDDGIAS